MRKSGIVLDISDANPAGTRLTPNTSSALESVLMLRLTTRIRPSMTLSVGTRSPRTRARVTRNVPPRIVRIAASSIGSV